MVLVPRVQGSGQRTQRLGSVCTHIHYMLAEVCPDCLPHRKYLSVAEFVQVRCLSFVRTPPDEASRDASNELKVLLRICFRTHVHWRFSTFMLRQPDGHWARLTHPWLPASSPKHLYLTQILRRLLSRSLLFLRSQWVT